jgi:hypothetical protein
LQELIAPRSVSFYSQGWVLIGEREALVGEIFDITGIGRSMLGPAGEISFYSIAQKMSWASRRKATRIEDQAYSLMGIFEINMPMLYGEGAKAFLRLQEEIIKVSDDETIFAWTDPDAEDDTVHGLLASSPSMFSQSGNFRPTMLAPQRLYSMTQSGLSIALPMGLGEDGAWSAELDCYTHSGGRAKVALYLKQIGSGQQQYARVRCNQRFVRLDVQAEPKRVFVRQWQPQSLQFPLFFHFKQNSYLGETTYPELLHSGFVAIPDYRPVSKPTLLSQPEPWLNRHAELHEIFTSGGTISSALLFRVEGPRGSHVVVMLSLDDKSAEPAYDAFETDEDDIHGLESLNDRFQPQRSPFKQLDCCRVGVTFGEKSSEGSTKAQLIPVNFIFDRSDRSIEAKQHTAR